MSKKKRILIVSFAVFVMLIAAAFQTHTFAALDVNQIFTGINTFANNLFANNIATKTFPTYNVKAYGALGGAQVNTTGSTTASSTTFGCSTCTFSSADIGKIIQIQQGGGSNIAFQTTISSYLDPQHVVLNAAPSNTASSQIFFWGWAADETAYESAVTAAGSQGGIIYFPPGTYMIGTNGPFVISSSYGPLDIAGDCGSKGGRVLAIGNAVPIPACTTILDGSNGNTPFQCDSCQNTKLHGFLFIGFPNQSSSTKHAFIDFSGRNDGGAEVTNAEIYDNAFWGNYNNIQSNYVIESYRVHDNASGCATGNFIYNNISHSQGANNLAYLDNYVDMNNSACPWTATAGINIDSIAYTATITNVSITSNVVTLTYSAPPPFIVTDNIVQSGLSSATFLNTVSLHITAVAGNTITAAYTHADYSSADSGTSTLTAGNVPNVTIQRNEIQNLLSGSATAVKVANCLNDCYIGNNDFENFYATGSLLYDIDVGQGPQNSFGLIIGPNNHLSPQNAIRLTNCLFGCEVHSQYYANAYGSHTMNGLTTVHMIKGQVYGSDYYSAGGGSEYVDGGSNGQNIFFFDPAVGGATTFQNGLNLSSISGSGSSPNTSFTFFSDYLSQSTPKSESTFWRLIKNDDPRQINFSFEGTGGTNPYSMLVYSYNNPGFTNFYELRVDIGKFNVLSPLNLVGQPLQVGGTTVIDSSRNGSFVDMNISGTCTGCTNNGPFTAALVTTAASSDNVTVTGATASSRCSVTATNATAATNIATTYISSKTSNQITVTHAVVANMNYDVMCSAN